jgi:hypothetical protein
MSDFNPNKLNVTFKADEAPSELVLPRRYTLTHSDLTGELFLTIGDEYDDAQVSGWYTRMMRDEVLAEWQEEDRLSFHAYCHVSGGLVFGSARWRYGIFKYHMPMVLQAFRHGDQELFHLNPELDNVEIWVHFNAIQTQFNITEQWGTFADYTLKDMRSARFSPDAHRSHHPRLPQDKL